MPLELINLNQTYFANLRDQGKTSKKSSKDSPKSIYFDKQFSVIDTYINSLMLPYINTLIDGRIPGTNNFGSIGKFLRYSPQYDNDGNLLTNLLWDVVKSTDFEDFTIPYSKIGNLPVGSTLSAGQDQNFVPVVPTEADQVLVSRNNDTSIWRKIRNDDIPDRGITGAMIEPGTLPSEVFMQGIIRTELIVDSITTNTFPAKAVTGAKIADGAIDETVMGADFANNFLNSIGSNFIPANSVDLSQVPNNRLDGLQFFQGNNVINARIFANTPWEERVFRTVADSSLIAPKSITGDKIDDGAIPANLLQMYVAPDAADPGIAILIDVGALEPEHFDNELKAYLHLV